MKYELTKSNVQDLIGWLRGGHVNRALMALEHLSPAAPTAAPQLPQREPMTEDEIISNIACRPREQTHYIRFARAIEAHHGILAQPPRGEVK